jgi:hypothetical protein
MLARLLSGRLDMEVSFLELQFLVLEIEKRNCLHRRERYLGALLRLLYSHLPNVLGIIDQTDAAQALRSALLPEVHRFYSF